MRFLLAAFLVGLGLFAAAPAYAQEGDATDSILGLGDGCPDSGAITKGKFISDFCWGCMFPVRIAGMGGGGRKFPGDTASPICVCPSKSLMGFPTPGFTFGMWKPTHFVETVRKPGCFPALDTKMKLGKILGISQGGAGHQSDNAGHHSTHLYAFPTGAILEMFTGAACGGDSYDLDLLMLSEIDPTYNNPQLSMVINPEANIFNNEIAIAACMVDAAASSAYRPIRELFWCLGSWGHMYPLAGTAKTRSSVQDASVMGAKLVAIQHKRLLMNRTYGNSAVCMPHPMPLYEKQQYRWQVLHPLPQKKSNDWTGSSTLLSREWRQVPVVGEDWVQVMSSYSECCVNLP